MLSIMQSIVMPSVAYAQFDKPCMLSVIMLSVVMLAIMAPATHLHQ